MAISDVPDPLQNTDEITKVRVEVVQGFAALRQEMTAGFAALRQEMADMRFDLLKWTFVFSVGQLVALAGFLAILLRFLRPGALNRLPLDGCSGRIAVSHVGRLAQW